LAIKRGNTVGDYKVIDLAGSGGMGAVYRIEHVITKRVEAMKVLPTGIGTSPENIRRFEREIEVQARLHHPNIVALYNAVRDDDSIALIMEYVEGESLEQMLLSGKLPLNAAVNYADQVLDALAYAHDNGVIHRDVKPANIIVTPAGTAKLMDFGLALAVTDLRLTDTGVAVGSAWYMSPEQVRASDELDARTDIYAFGAVLHEMLTGKKLFDADGSFAVMRAQMEAVPQAPSAFNPEVSAALDDAIARALAKDPAARFQTAREFRIALDGSLAGARPEDATPVIPYVQNATGPHAAWVALSNPSLRHERHQSSRATAPLVLAPTLVVVVLAVVLSETTRVGVRVRVPLDSVSMPTQVNARPFVTDSPPSDAVALHAPKFPTKAATSTTSSAALSTVSIPQAGNQTSVINGTDIPTAASTTRSLKPSLRVPQRTYKAALTATPSSPEAKPQGTSNRFIRVLSKLNPFHRSVKDDSGEPAPPTKGIAK
jgi:serine/threonine-protein kinase